MNRQSMLPSSSPWSFPQSQSCYHVPAFNSQSAQFSTYCWPFTAHLLPFIYSQIIPLLLHQYAHPVLPTYICSAHLCSCVCHNVMAEVCNNEPIISQSTPFQDSHTNITYSALRHLLRTVKKAPPPHPSTTTSTSVPSSADHTHTSCLKLVF